MKGVLIPVTIEGIKTRRDKTVSIAIGTQELSPDKAGEIFMLNGKFGFAYISAQNPEIEDIEVIDSLEPDMPHKSLSQRLRGVLYRMWEKNPEGYTDSNLHYMKYMEEIISKYKLRI